MVGEVFQPIVEITCLSTASTSAMGKKHGFPKVIAWDKIVETMCGFNMFQCVFHVQNFCYYIIHIESPCPSLVFGKELCGVISIVGAEGKRFLSALQFSACQDSAPTKPLMGCTFENHKPLGFQKTVIFPQ